MSFILIITTLILTINASFTPDFNDFLTKMYGEAGQKLLERKDFGDLGSFGGKVKLNQNVTKEPVLIVHGITNLAGNFNFVLQYLRKRGYNNAEMYGTTYGDGTKKSLIFVKLQCQFVRQVRALLQAVFHYTGKKLDVLAYSMGSPVARKAILGGFCEGDYIGPSLTYMVDTFVGIAGANFGSKWCFVPFWVCSMRNGLHCKSKFLKGLNNQTARYEGEYSYAIYTDTDEKVGETCCGNKCSHIPNSIEEFELKGLTHDTKFHRTKYLMANVNIMQFESQITAENGPFQLGQIMSESLDIQYSLITKHSSPEPPVNRRNGTNSTRISPLTIV